MTDHTNTVPPSDCITCSVPTDNAQGICSFCLDYEAPGVRLEVLRDCALIATGDAARVTVYRSPVVKDGSRLFAPVRKHIEAHGMWLVFKETDPDPAWLFGQRIREIYAAR